MRAFELFGEIFLRDNDTSKKLGEIDGKAQKTDSTLHKGIATAAKWGIGLAAAATAAAGAILGVAVKSAEATDRIDKMSQKLGLSRKGFQEWDYILSQNGASIDTMGAGMKSLNRLMDDTAQGGKDSAKTLDRLGVSLKGMNQEQAFEATVTALQGMKNGAEKSALAVELFGRSGQELMPLLNGAGGSVDELKQKAKDLGMVLSDDAIDAGVKFTDQLDTMKRTLGSVVSQIGVKLMPMFSNLLTWVMERMPQIQETFKTVFGALSNVVTIAGNVVKDYLIPAFKNIYDFVQENMPTIQATFDTVFDGIKVAVDIAKDALKLFVDMITTVSTWISENQTLVENIALVIGSFAAAWGLVNLALGIWATVGAIATGITTAFGVAVAFLTSPIGLVILAIGAIIAIGILLYKNWDKIKAFMLALWETLKTKATEIFAAIWNTIKNAFSATIAWFKNIFTSAWNGIKSVFSSVGSFFGGLWNTIKSKFTTIGSAIGNAIGGAFKKVVNSIINFAENTINGFIRAINRAVGMINKIPGVNISSVSTLSVPRLGYATGTNNATKGFHWVGEEGPELLNFKGGETVTNAKDSAKIASGKNSGFNLTIETFVNERKQDVEELAEELSYYIKKKELGGV